MNTDDEILSYILENDYIQDDCTDENKVKNPKTGKCIKKCADTQQRNTKTGKCIKKCKDGQIRDKKTGRCINKKSDKKISPIEDISSEIDERIEDISSERNDEKDDYEQDDCPEGKVKNPKTNKCIKKCDIGYERNINTGRCLKKCKEGQLRDEKTGRCINKKQKTGKKLEIGKKDEKKYEEPDTDNKIITDLDENRICATKNRDGKIKYTKKDLIEIAVKNGYLLSKIKKLSLFELCKLLKIPIEDEQKEKKGCVNISEQDVREWLNQFPMVKEFKYIAPTLENIFGNDINLETLEKYWEKYKEEYEKHEKEMKEIKERKVDIKYDCLKGRKNIKLKTHQKKVVEYLMHNRGILATHAVGSGKTLTAVAAAECILANFKNVKRVVVITPTSLQENFKKEMKSFGVRDNNKYEFYTYNQFLKMKDLDCNNTFLIIDEVHNLRTEIKYKKDGTLRSGKKITKILLCAKKAFKVLLLTATPVINSIEDLDNIYSMITKYEDKEINLDKNELMKCKVSVYEPCEKKLKKYYLNLILLLPLVNV